MGAAFSLDLDDFFDDPDMDTLTYSITNSADLPAAIGISGSNAAGTFAAGDEGSYTVNYQACDSEPLCVTGSGSLTVNAGGGSSGGLATGPAWLVAMASLLGLLRFWRRQRD